MHSCLSSTRKQLAIWWVHFGLLFYLYGLHRRLGLRIWRRVKKNIEIINSRNWMPCRPVVEMYVLITQHCQIPVSHADTQCIHNICMQWTKPYCLHARPKSSSKTGFPTCVNGETANWSSLGTKFSSLRCGKCLWCSFQHRMQVQSPGWSSYFDPTTPLVTVGWSMLKVRYRRLPCACRHSLMWQNMCLWQNGPQRKCSSCKL